MKTLLLIRHGESQGNAEGRIQGWNDCALTERGHRQAARIADRLAQEQRCSALYSSTLRRALDTAAPAAARLGLPIRLDARLREYDFGPLAGILRIELARHYPAIAEAWDCNQVGPPLPGEEGWPAFDARVSAALEQIVADTPEQSAVALFMHGGSINSALCRLLGVRERSLRPFTCANASLTVVELHGDCRGDRPDAPFHGRLVLLSDASYLDSVERVDTWLAPSCAGPARASQH